MLTDLEKSNMDRRRDLFFLMSGYQKERADDINELLGHGYHIKTMVATNEAVAVYLAYAPLMNVFNE